MSKTCIGCCKPFSLMNPASKPFSGSSLDFCRSCCSVLIPHVDAMWEAKDPEAVRKAYIALYQAIKDSSLLNQDAIIGDTEKLYVSRMADCGVKVEGTSHLMHSLDEEIEEGKRAEEARKLEESAKKRAMAQMLITSGFQFDGYRIVKYSGYISGDDAIQVARGKDSFWYSSTTNVGEALMDSLVKIRRKALQELKEAAYELGCNAVIGVDFDYITLEPEKANFNGGTTYLPYVFGVTANGNAVVIEKIEDDAPRPAADYGAPRRRNTLRPSDFE